MISSWAHLFVSKVLNSIVEIIPRHRCTCVSNTTFWFVITIINIYCLLQKRRFWVNHTSKPIKDTCKILLFIEKILTGEWANVNIPSLAMQYLFCQTFRKLKYKDTKKNIKKVTHLKWLSVSLSGQDCWTWTCLFLSLSFSSMKTQEKNLIRANSVLASTSELCKHRTHFLRIQNFSRLHVQARSAAISSVSVCYLFH